MADESKTNGVQSNAQRMSRADVAKHLGLTKGAVRYLESSGALHPTVSGAKGIAWYDRAEVIAFAARRQKKHPRARLTQGAIEAAAMVQFERHREAGTIARCVPDVVIATLLPAEEVIRLRDIYARERGVTILAAPSLPKPEEERAIDERARENERSDFDRQMADRRRDIDRALGEETKDEEDEEDRPRRKRR